MNKLYYLFATIIILSSCKKPTSAIEGYSKDDNGFYYKLLAIGEGNNHPAETDVILVNAVMKNLNDSVFWDTNHDAENGLFIELSPVLKKYSCHPYFANAVVGDSVSFYINPTHFFKEYFNMETPSFCKKDSLIKMDLKITKIISKPEYLELKNKINARNEEDRELEELKQIDDFIKSNSLEITADANGIYWLNREYNDSESVSWGKRVNVEFQGYFLDGRPIAQGMQSMEFSYGTPDQITAGLNIVIGKLKNGEFAKIILPSRLAFGEKGSVNGTIKPYTPLVFEIKITDVKTINP